MEGTPSRGLQRAAALLFGGAVAICCGGAWAEDGFPKPYSPPCTEREGVFEFTARPSVRSLGNDRYEIAFAVKGYCDVTVGLLDEKGLVVRHLASGVLGANAPAPFQKNCLKQALYWDGKDDLGGYVKEPQLLRVRVGLGLKPEFERLLADGGPHHLPPLVIGIALDENGAYVFAKGPSPHAHVLLRHYDRDGNYVGQLTPAPANLPLEKLGGLIGVEYEPGKRAVHGPDLTQLHADAFYLTGISGKRVGVLQPAIIGGRIHYANGGLLNELPGRIPSRIFSIGTDGSTDAAGMNGSLLVKDGGHLHPRFAASPDGKRIYLAGLKTPVVMVYEVGGTGYARAFAGRFAKGNYGNPQYVPDSSNEGFNDPQGIDCDGSERVYVADSANNRVQVFKPHGEAAAGTWVKSIPVDRPQLVRVHRKSGAIYVLHGARVQGKTVGRVTKFKSFEDPQEVWHQDLPEKEPVPSCLAVDEWSARPRLWMGGGGILLMAGGIGGDPSTVRIWEDQGTGLKALTDFEERTARYTGGKALGRTWIGNGVCGSSGGGTVACDPIREKAYFFAKHLFDLKTGAWEGDAAFPGNVNPVVNDMAFDKRGYAHLHFSAGHYMPGVARVDPGRNHQEVPYNYGEEKVGVAGPRWSGLLPVRDQPGAKFFQDGLGVNMAGDVAEVCNIYYIPKLDENFGGIADPGANEFSGGGGKADSFKAAVRNLLESQKKGEQIYFIRRVPGVPLSCGTIWTYDGNGELRDECAVIAGLVINGVMLDENGCLYFVNSRTRMIEGKPFLSGRGVVLGAGDGGKRSDPFTGTLFKTGRRARILLANAPIPLDQPPARPPDLAGNAWIEGAEWLYAGASPIVPADPCSCPTQRLHLDWYKRTFVPESYRHSIGVLDTNGNLILHLGTYGNYDSGFGAKSRIPVGGDNLAFYVPRHLSGTDHHLVVADYGERLVVLRLNYQTEETVAIAK